MARLFIVAALLLRQIDAADFTSLAVTPRLSGVAAQVGETPDEIFISFEPQTALIADGDTLTIDVTGGGGNAFFAADVASFTITSPSGLAVATATATYTLLAPRQLVITFAAATDANVPSGSATTISLKAPLDGVASPVAFNTVDAATYTFNAATPSDTAGTPATFTAAAGGGVSGDPITFWNGNKVKFWLPMRTEVPLLETPHLILWATPLQGPTEDLQWFESFKVTSPSHDFVAKVDLDSVGNNQIDVVVGQAKVPMRSGGVQVSNSPLRLAVSDVKLRNNRVHGANTTKYFFVESPEVSFALFSSYAGTEFPDDLNLQKKYQHLNFLPMDIVDHSNFKGALPQMWGLVPMEADTAAMLVPPSEARKASEPTSCDSGMIQDGLVQACM